MPTSGRRYAAFISYAHRYADWVGVLHANLERCLAAAGDDRKVFLDQVDLGAGHSWVGQLQAGLDQADRLVLVATPEALASSRVDDEWQSFIALHREWARGFLQIVHLVDVPLPPFLTAIQRVDFRQHDGAKYRRSLAELSAGLLGREDRRQLPELPPDLEIPEPPAESLPSTLRMKLVDWLTPVLRSKAYRRVVATGLGLERSALDGYSSLDVAASAALVRATGDDDPLVAARRIAGVLADELGEDERERVAELEAIAAELEAVKRPGPEGGLIRLWLDKVGRDHETLVPYFRQGGELELLDRVYVQLELRRHAVELAARKGREERLDRPWSLDELLELDPLEHGWVTRRWVVRGDPGAGKTTLLRHLAGTLAREGAARWAPVFESLPRLLRQREWLLDRIARQLGRAGHPARGLAAALDQLGREGQLLVLLDGLDEVAAEDRGDAEGLLRDLGARWPATPLVVTSRPIGYRRPGSEFQEVELLPFDRERRWQFLGRWFGRADGAPDMERAALEAPKLEADPGLRELASNPLYLTLMALLLEEGQEPHRNRTRLYDQVFELLLEGRHRPAGEPMEHQDAVRRVLRHLACEMTIANRDAEPLTALEARLYQPAADALREPLERVPRWRRSMRPFLDDLARRTGILGPHDGPDAEWRFWHRTFREALSAEKLEEDLGLAGREAVLENAREISGDESRWAEPFALLAGRVEDPDDLIRALVEENRSLGLRALATAQGLRDETLREILQLTGNLKERAKVYGRVPELVGEPERALALLDRLRRRTRDGNDLFHLDLAVGEVGRRWEEHAPRGEALRSRFYDHVPKPPDDLFRWVETPLDGRVELWREIPAGRFLMGSPEGEKGRYSDEGPRHEVTVVSGYTLAAVPVTNAQYAAFDPSHKIQSQEGVSAEELAHHPVVDVTWYQAVSFCRWLGLAFPWARGARLPTEEEWEYACRAGTESCYWSGDKDGDLDHVGWYGSNSDGRTHRVGEKLANPWGLYDVHGNVYEWMLSRWTNDYSGREDGVEADPQAGEPADLAEQSSGADRVFRGGSFGYVARNARSANRNWYVPGTEIWFGDQGFRVLLPGAPRSSS